MARRVGARADRFHVPGVWLAALQARRDDDARDVFDDPREVFFIEGDALRDLKQAARARADQRYAAGEPVTVGLAVLRGLAPKEVLFRDRTVHRFRVYADDTVAPAPSAFG